MRHEDNESVPDRLLALGGLVGPALFVADWAVLGLIRTGYSPTGDAISRLAELGASTRPEMTAGFVIYGLGLLSYGAAVRRAVPGPAWRWAVGTGAATLGVAAFPLGRPISGNVHAVFAVLGYAGLAGLQVEGWRVRTAQGQHRTARLSLVTGVVTAAALLISITVGPRHGLAQRVGLTAGDTWIVVTSLALLRRPRRS